MEIIPAIDLRQGRCVRLYQGDYAQEIVFSEDPVGMARHWQAQGAKRLHLVDLDGAASGVMENAAVIKEIIRAIAVPVQVGGGVRDLATVEELLGAGADRVVLGTSAVKDQALVSEACRRFGKAIAIAIDTRDSYVMEQGWREASTMTAHQFLALMLALGAPRFIYTDVARDGTLSEPNFSAIQEVVRRTPRPVIAAGGVSRLEHLARLRDLGVEGAIIGRALYEGKLELREAIQGF